MIRGRFPSPLILVLAGLSIGAVYWGVRVLSSSSPQAAVFTFSNHTAADVHFSLEHHLEHQPLTGDREENHLRIRGLGLVRPVWNTQDQAEFACLLDELEISRIDGPTLFQFKRHPLSAHVYRTHPQLSPDDRQRWFELFDINLQDHNLYSDHSLLQASFRITLDHNGRIQRFQWPQGWRKLWQEVLKDHPMTTQIRALMEGGFSPRIEDKQWSFSTEFTADRSLFQHRASCHCQLNLTATVSPLDHESAIREEEWESTPLPQ